ncbi:hypothetical protein QTP88_003857 [Uroleucon formosanum]
MTVELSGEHYPTLSMVIPLIRGLQYTLKNKTTTTAAGTLLKKTAIDVVARRLGILESNKIVAKATFLDPRFKKTGFGLVDNANNTEKWITDEINSIMRNTQENETSNMPINTEPNLLWEHFDIKIKDLEKLLVTIKEDENKVKLISKIDNLLQNIELQFDEFSFDFNFKENEDCINDKFTQIFSEISTECRPLSGRVDSAGLLTTNGT